MISRLLVKPIDSLSTGALIAMPIYEYECEKCGCHFDVLQSFSDPEVKVCQRDGCPGRVRKVLSPPTVIFKGSGFYTTDYARKGSSPSSSKKGDDSPAKSEEVSSKVAETAKASAGKDE